MNEIICPHCKKAFKVDEAGFADIVKQVRDHQFEEELNNRLTLAEKEKDSAVKLAEANIKTAAQQELVTKDKEISDLKAENSLHLAEQLAKKEAEIAEMNSKIQNAELDKKLEVSEAIKLIEPQYLIPHSSDFILNGKRKDEFLKALEKQYINKVKVIKYD